MRTVHNANISQFIAVFVTVMIEALLAFFSGWTLYDVFRPWGQVPAVIVGVGVGVVFFALYLYVFIFREYAREAIKVFAVGRGFDPKGLLTWAFILVFLCLAMDTFFNTDRVLVLGFLDFRQAVMIWAGVEILAIIPLPLGKVVHAHVNTINLPQARAAHIANIVDGKLTQKVAKGVKGMSAGDLLRLKAGDAAPLDKLVDEETTRARQAEEKRRAEAEIARAREAAARQKEMEEGKPSPLESLLTTLGIRQASEMPQASYPQPQETAQQNGSAQK